MILQETHTYSLVYDFISDISKIRRNWADQALDA